LRQLHPQRLDQLWVVTVERLLIAALDEEFVCITKNQRPEAIPLRLEEPPSPSGKAWTGLASIGRTGGLTARCTTAFLEARDAGLHAMAP
jgi:hypothetical protein